jgi:hypothetical protein
MTQSLQGREIISRGELNIHFCPPATTETYISQIKSLPDSLETTFQDVEDATNFRMFSLIGGPSPNGGAITVMRVQTGRSRTRAAGLDGSFESFLGDLYPTLKLKWIQWLATTYCECFTSPAVNTCSPFIAKDEAHRTDLLEVSPDPIPPSLGGSVIPETPRSTPDTSRPGSPAAPTPPPARRNTLRPSRSSRRVTTTPVLGGSVIPETPRSTPDTSRPESPAAPTPPLVRRNTLRPSRSSRRITTTPPPPSTRLPTSSLPLQDPPTSPVPPPASRSRGSVPYISVPPHRKKRPLVSSDTSGVSDTDFEGGEELSPSCLVEEHPTFLHKGLDFLLAVPGGGSWKQLLSRYVEFEKLAPLVSVVWLLFLAFEANEISRPRQNSPPSLVLMRSAGGSVLDAAILTRDPKSHPFKNSNSCGFLGGPRCNQSGGAKAVGLYFETHWPVVRGTTSSLEERMVSLS